MIFYKLTCVKITVETIPKITLVKAFSFNFSLEDKYTLSGIKYRFSDSQFFVANFD